MLKKLLIAGVAVALVVAGAIAFLVSNVDSIVEKAIETLDPRMTGTTVEVGRVALGLTDGRGTIERLVVGNPKGYKAPQAFRLSSIVLGLDASTVANDVIVTRELTIEAPDLFYEKGPGGSNVETIQRNVDQYMKANFGGGAGKAQGTGGKGDAAKETRFIVERLQIRNGKVRLVGVPGKEPEVALPAVSMRDVGKGRGGLTAGELASIVIKQMTDGVVAATARGVTDRARRAIEGLRGTTGR
jgi:hypothetical protein